MKSFINYSAFCILNFAFFISSVSALDINIDGLPYNDVSQFNQEEAAAISFLTELGIVQGNEDGTFRTRSTLNRAEFVTIAMRIDPMGGSMIDTNCFPDVSPDAWYAQAVCKAKIFGIVNGNAVDGVPKDEWLFAPDRDVQYEEAIKVLVEIFNIPVSQQDLSSQWFVKYLNVADSLGLGLDVVFPGDKLFRGEMAILTAKFKSYADGELNELLDAMNGIYSSSSLESLSFSSAPAEGRSNSSVSSSSSAPAEGRSNGSVSSFTYDPYEYTSATADFLSLGEVSPVLAAANAFSELEPINITDFIVTLNSAVASLDAFLVYDEEQRYLGVASRDSSVSSGKVYRLRVDSLNIQFPKQENYGFYVRARLKSYYEGGTSGEIVKVDSLGIEGTGEWSGLNYLSSSSDNYPSFQTSRSRIISIENDDSETGFLVPGTNIEIASFRFSGSKGDGQADLRFTDISFGIAAVGGTTVSNVKLGSQGVDGTMDCSVSSGTITCLDIESTFGTFDDSDRIIVLYADVSIDESFTNRSLQIVLNRPGSVDTVGDITWTDGDTSFTWVQFGSPVVRGTRWE